VKGPLEVAKMSGAGNDFLVFDAREALGRDDDRGWIGRVCRRGLSVGADGVLFVEPTRNGGVRVRFRNPDGSAAFCGNGTRCAARFANKRGWCGDTVTLETEVGEVEARISGVRVRLRLPPPVDRGALELEAAGRVFSGHAILAGVPHLVIEVPEVEAAPLERWGPALRRHAALGPEGANVDLVARGETTRLHVRTWERGVEGETLACGSAAVACAFWARLAGGAEDQTIVPASGVALEVSLPGPPRAPSAAFLTGDARFVLEGRLHPEADFADGDA
jgi:diaminopimelate epimerase